MRRLLALLQGALHCPQGRLPLRVCILGNCVAQRIQNMLPSYPGFAERYTIVELPMIHLLATPEEWDRVAQTVLSCDVILTQPLFSYGPCNTESLRAALRAGRRFGVFASANFEAYFPDSFVARGKTGLRFPPPFDWDSLVFFSCYVNGVSIFDVEAIYLNHPLFHEAAMKNCLSETLEKYGEREKGLDIPTFPYALRRYAGEKLFHSPRHPVDDFLRRMLADIAGWLGLEPDAPDLPVDGFGFNQWAVITRHHSFFRFPEQAYFVVAGNRVSIEDMAMTYYTFYDFHPHVVEANRHRAIAV